MAWFGTAAKVAGLGFGIADLLGGGGDDSYTPWQQGHAAWMFNNPNRYTPFGNIEFIREDPNNTPNRYRDDILSVRQTLSPEMQAIADRLLGMVGRGEDVYSSRGMGSELAQRLDSVLGPAASSQYTPGAYGFEQGRGAVQVPEPEPEEQLPQTYDGQSYQSLVNALMSGRSQWGV